MVERSGGSNAKSKGKARLGIKLSALYIVLLLVLGPVAQIGGTEGSDDDRGIRYCDGYPVWSDTLDDMSHVYLPGGSLVGLEVSTGGAQLKAGEEEGWIASSIISAPVGYRYSLVLLEVEHPDNSTFEISVLDASQGPTGIGFANATVDGFEKVEAVELSLEKVDVLDYPNIRVQVNLYGNGTNQPRLLGWSVHFVELDEWRDDVLGIAKMSRTHRVNITDGKVDIDLSEGRPGGSGPLLDYGSFPPIITPGGGGQDPHPVFYANSNRTGYKDKGDFSSEGLNDAIFADLNEDGYLDMVEVRNGFSGPRTSYIRWGTEVEEDWSESDTTLLNLNRGWAAEFGDFNCDGEMDIVMSCQGSGATGSGIFLNKGTGQFSSDPDVLFPEQYQHIGVGDLNNDGYDDLVFQANKYDVYMSDNDIVDTTVDMQFEKGSQNYDILVEDLDLDGYLDVVPGTSISDKLKIYLGGSDGPDTTADILLSVPQHCFGAEFGDVNGDGWGDLVAFGGANNERKVYIFEGGSSGFSDNDVHTIDYGNNNCQDPEVLDIDRDGFDDLIMVDNSNTMKIYFGDIAWPTSPAITKTNAWTRMVCIAAPDEHFIPGLFGVVITEAIRLPDGKYWDLLDIEATLPQNTSLEYTILNGNKKPIYGYRDLTDLNVDLSPIFNQDTIHIRFNLRTEFNNTTPNIDLVTVRWQDDMTWREQFYGPAKTERYLGLDIADGTLQKPAGAGRTKELLFASERCDEGFTTDSQCYLDAGGLDYSRELLSFTTKGVSSLAVNDANGDGFDDVLFASYRKTPNDHETKSPLFLNSHEGWNPEPDHEFSTLGASDVVLEDLNGDGHMDVVFAQETDGDTTSVNSTLFWGSDDGWNAAPDVLFTTQGASGVVAVDLDDDGLLDLVFSCFKGTSTSTDSMVFLQTAEGFDGTSPDSLLPTNGARAVDAGDLDRDGKVDLVFANSLSGGLTEIDSLVYWGKADGAFETTTTRFPTVGASDVRMADVDKDGDLDLVFANRVDNNEDYYVDSFVYLGAGSRSWSSIPDHVLPTWGANSVYVADLDGSGWKDLVFACGYEGSTYDNPSVIFFGGTSGWSSTPDVTIPTKGATEVVVHDLVKTAYGGYLSQVIEPDDPWNTGSFHTMRCMATLGASQSAEVHLLDADTGEVLVTKPVRSGDNVWVVEDAFIVRDHPRIRVRVIAEGLDSVGAFALDDIWLNWTERVYRPPVLKGLSVDVSEVFRTGSVTLQVDAMDEYDLQKDLRVTVQYRLNGTEDWLIELLKPSHFDDVTKPVEFITRIDTPIGLYDFRVNIRDSDRLETGFVEFPNLVEVLNNRPTSPQINLLPARADTSSNLQVEIVRGAQDVESYGLTYQYLWYLNGELQSLLVIDTVESSLTEKGQNWSVEVRASDGLDIGPPATARRTIENAAPRMRSQLVDVMMDEDTVDSEWLDLSTAFEDPDGDILEWTVNPTPDHIDVQIDTETGKVTLTPEENWSGNEDLTFIVSDGELQATQTVKVEVIPVNDIPRFASVNGEPVEDGPIEITIMQGEMLAIDVLVLDEEGDELVFDTNSSLVQLDGLTGSIRWTPDNDMVGTLRFGLTVWDVVSTTKKVTIDFIVEVVNENDPMSDPRITGPKEGDRYEEGNPFSFIVICSDPDAVYGQVLNYSWSSNLSGHLGFGSSMNIPLSGVGTHVITITVSDGEFEKRATVTVTVYAKVVDDPDPIDNGGGGGSEPVNYGLILGILVVLVVVGVVFVVARTRKDTEEGEAADEDEYKRDHMVRAHAAIKEAADALEAGRPGDQKEEEPGFELEEIAIDANDVPQMALSMEAKKTEAASAQTMALFEGNGDSEPVMSEEEHEQLRVDNLKRKYQNAIGRLPYGIPSEELRERDWVDLASELATGEKRMSSDGRETTNIDGRWYFSDPDDTGSFLKEEGAKQNGAPKKQPVTMTDREVLLAKLEERFILGEISEETYNKLRKKYEGETLG